jgi:hypothetical protein
MSRATDANMSVQFYVANQPTPAIHTQVWQKTSNGDPARVTLEVQRPKPER